MELQAQFCLFGLAFFLFYCSPCKPKKLNGYAFPVYTTDMCPRDKTEWDKRSSAINCTKNNGYICIPNENRTALLEFCYIYPTTWINKGVCLYLIKRYSRVDSYKCNNFEYGCPDIAYKATQLIHYKSCISIRNGCFLAEPLCKKEWKDNTTDYEQTTQHKDIEIYPVEDNTMEVLLVTVISILLILILIIVYVCCRKRKCSISDEENPAADPNSEGDPLLANLYNQQNTVTEEEMELRFENGVLDQWREDNTFFFPTRACKEVEKKIRNQNLVIVTGHSGSGKSAIIQHIALKYKDQGWIVKSLKGVMEMRKYILDQERYLNSTILVLNDPFGKDSFDKASYLLWKKSEQTILTFFKKGKLLISCRNHILFDNKVKGDLKEKTNIVNIEDVECKLTHEEKRCIWNKYMSNDKISEEDFTEILNIEAYFPLLCKLFSCDMKYQSNGYRFFKEPVKVIEEQIRCFRKEDRGKYCALVLLVLFNNNFCSEDAVRNELLSYSFKGALKMCELPNDTQPYDIGGNLDLLKGFFVKKIGDAYEFYHDFVMEVTSFLLGKDHPAELIQYADIRFLLRRVTLDNGIEQNRPFTIYLNDVRNIDILGERFFNALFEECYLEVILHPALRDKRLIKVLQKEFERHPERLQELLRTKKSIYDDHKLYWPITDDCMAKLGLVAMENKFSPFCALVAFCDTDLISHCFQAFRQLETDLIGINIVTAVCCNGSKDFFKMLANDYIKDSLTETFGDLFPIHIAALLYNFEILEELIHLGAEVNMKTKDEKSLTPLMFAASRYDTDPRDNNYNMETSIRRDQTVQMLIDYAADVNFCAGDGVSSLYIACQNGHTSMVEILLRKGAEINSSNAEDEVSPLYVACENEHLSTVQSLVDHGAQVNLCTSSGASPLFIACQKGYNNAVQILISKGAAVNMCKYNGASPLYIACQNDHISTVKLLLDNGADVNLCKEDKTSPLFIACKKGNENLVQPLLDNGADINICDKDGFSPLLIACQKGYNKIVQLLLTNGANINLCTLEGFSPLFVACQNGHEETVRTLLKHGAKVNLCTSSGASPLFIASLKGFDSSVQLLLDKGAAVNICMKNGASPLYVACQDDHISTVKLLLNNEADVNLCRKNNTSPLFIACLTGNENLVQLLLDNGADINICEEGGASPLLIACQRGYIKIVQLLLTNGANIDLCTLEGFSPLFTACENGHEETVRTLLENGANTNIRSIKGTAEDIALQYGHEIIVQMLKKIIYCKENGDHLNPRVCLNR